MTREPQAESVTGVSGVRLRPAEPRDVPTILRLIRELAEYEREPQAVVATEAMLHQSLFGAGWRGEAGQAQGVVTPSCEAIMAEEVGGVGGAAGDAGQSVPLGFALYFMNYSTWKGRAGVYLEDLYVTPAARGRGVGTALLRALAQVAVQRGCVRMEWSVLDWNTPAIEFYAALGARPMSEWTVFRMDEPAIARLAGGRGAGKSG
jgi:GNAT superfamily N-acetyltransferase